jgi:hypothetical protein
MLFKIFVNVQLITSNLKPLYFKLQLAQVAVKSLFITE